MLENIYKYKEKTFIFHILHIIPVILFLFTKNINLYTILYNYIILFLARTSITAGYHRMFCHKSYEGKMPLQLFYIIFGTSAFQQSVLWWVKSHRAHHTNEDKDGDPYNIKKGLWYSHIGWLVNGVSESEDKAIKKIDMSDLESNKMLVFQAKYYVTLLIISTIIIISIPVIFWKETIVNSAFVNFVRIIILLHFSWCVNSLAHYYGNKSYSKKIQARENLFVSLISGGEGWHNYHHAYPKDYKASEFSKYNLTTYFILLTKFLGMSKNLLYKKNNIQNKDKFNVKKYAVYN